MLNDSLENIWKYGFNSVNIALIKLIFQEITLHEYLKSKDRKNRNNLKLKSIVECVWDIYNFATHNDSHCLQYMALSFLKKCQNTDKTIVCNVTQLHANALKKEYFKLQKIEQNFTPEYSYFVFLFSFFF